jgi:hypothetical protein
MVQDLPQRATVVSSTRLLSIDSVTGLEPKQRKSQDKKEFSWHLLGEGHVETQLIAAGDQRKDESAEGDHVGGDSLKKSKGQRHGLGN